VVDFGPKAPKWSPLTSVTQSQRIWTQDTAIPTSLPCCARASFFFMFETFVDFAGLQRSRAARERRLPEEFKPHLKRTPRYAGRRSFGPKTRRIGHRSRAASEHHCTGHARDIRRLWSRTLPIRPEPENRYFS